MPGMTGSRHGYLPVAAQRWLRIFWSDGGRARQARRSAEQRPLLRESGPAGSLNDPPTETTLFGTHTGALGMYRQNVTRPSRRCIGGGSFDESPEQAFRYGLSDVPSIVHCHPQNQECFALGAQRIPRDI